MSGKPGILSFIFVSFFSFTSLAALTPRETEALNAKLQRFYQMPWDPQAMNQPTMKTWVQTGEAAHLNASLKDPKLKSSNLLEQQAQKKTTNEFRLYHCEHVLKRVFPGVDCKKNEAAQMHLSPLAQIEPRDRVEDLAATWTSYITFNLDELPVTGRSGRPLWSDDYWAMKWGLTSYRYSEAEEFETYKEAISSYLQPAEFLKLIGFGDWAQTTIAWSPAEKYDLSVGDQAFTLTNEQKNEGKDSIGSDGDVEEWMGLCHGWAPASIMVDRPTKPVTVLSQRGREIVWYPNDIKAMLTLAYSNGKYSHNFIGGRCNNKKPKSFANGRLSESECFDNNPATFHLSLSNMIGREKASFVMDKTFDYEVWNQPVVGYEFTYFNPLQPNSRSQNWRDVAVAYDEQFKSRDRFQVPLTRGRVVSGPRRLRDRFRRGGGDSEVRQMVGVIAEVIWLAEVTPEHSPEVQSDELVREIYTYDLEIGDDGGEAVVLGGEWHDNNHPDFLFVPHKDTYVGEQWDKQTLDYNGSEGPSAELGAVAAQASFQEGYPLCTVVKHLVKESTGVDSIHCQ